MRQWICMPVEEGSLYLWHILGSCKHIPIFGADNRYIRFCVEPTCPFSKLLKGDAK